MEIVKKAENGKVTLNISGRLDTSTAPDLEKAVNELIGNTKELVFDFANLDYISSAGLRVVMYSYKLMLNQGSFTVINANEEIKNIFEMTGFSTFLTLL